MFILTKLTLTIRVDEVFSLKQKRSIIKKIKTHVLNAYKACIVESHQQDTLRYIGLTIGFLSKNNCGIQTIKEELMQEIEMISEGFIEEETLDQI